MRILLSLFLVVTLAACGGEDAAGPASVSAAARIIKVGAPVDADAASDGSHLVLFRRSEDSVDVQETAWRLYDGGGTEVAEGVGGDTVVGTGDGFWIGDRYVAKDGKVSTLTAKPLAPERGDVVVSDPATLERQAVRPDPLTLLTPSPAPVKDAQGWTIDSQGKQWMQGADADTVSVNDGSGWTSMGPVPLADGQHLANLGLTRVGEWLVIPVTGPLQSGEQARFPRFAARLNGAPPREPWRMIPAGPLAKQLRESHPSSFAADDDHYVFWDYRGAPYVLNMTGGAVTEMVLPSAEKQWSLQGGLDGVYAFPPQGSELGRTTWFTPDLGQTWVQLPT